MFLISTDGSKSKITNIDMKKLNYKNYFNNKMISFREEGFERKFTPILRELESFPFSRVQYGGVQDLNHSYSSDNDRDRRSRSRQSSSDQNRNRRYSDHRNRRRSNSRKSSNSPP